MTRAGAHREVVDLLPWFVNGTLAPADRARVEAHVSECMSCYAALQQERRLNTLVAGQSAGRISSAEHGFERLTARLEAPPDKALWARRGVTALAVAASIAAIGVAVLLWTQSARDAGSAAGSFETLADPGVAGAGRLDVVFAEELPEAELRELLRSNGATIVGGPTEIGRYTIRLDPALNESEVDRAVERLRSDARVRFVGRSFIEEGEL